MIPAIRAQAPLLDRVASQVQLDRKGDKWWGCCPLHQEKTASFMVDESDQHFHCYGCGLHGDVIDWVMLTQKLSKADAIKLLANELGLRKEPQPILSTESEFVAVRDLPAMRATLQSEFEILSTKLDTCLREIQRLTKRTDNVGHELVAERQIEKVGIETQLTTFFQRKGFLNWTDWWAMYSDALFSGLIQQVTPGEWRGHGYRSREKRQHTAQCGAWEWQECCQPGFTRMLTEDELAYLSLIFDAAKVQRVHPMQVAQAWERVEPMIHDEWPTVEFIAKVESEESELNQ